MADIVIVGLAFTSTAINKHLHHVFVITFRIILAHSTTLLSGIVVSMCADANLAVKRRLSLVLFTAYMDFFQGNDFVVVFLVLIPVLNKSGENRVILSCHNQVALDI